MKEIPKVVADLETFKYFEWQYMGMWEGYEVYDERIPERYFKKGDPSGIYLEDAPCINPIPPILYDGEKVRRATHSEWPKIICCPPPWTD